MVSTTSPPPAAELWRGRPDRWMETVSLGKFQAYKWIQFVSDAIYEAITTPGGGRLILNAPPQTGKSVFISGHVIPWYLSLFPQRRTIYATHTAGYAKYWGRYCRNQVTRSGMSTAEIEDDSKAANEWVTTKGGGMVSTGVGGGLSGRPGELIIVDDPIPDWARAYSAAYRRLCIDWFDSTLYTRKQPNTTIIVLMTRWHPEDLTGYLTKSHNDKWRQISLAALAEANDVMGRAIGEPLCPERFTAASYRGAQGNKSTWTAIYQQRPTTAGSGLWFEHWGAVNLSPAVTLNRALPIDLSFDFNSDPGMHIEIGQHEDGLGDIQIWTRHEVGPQSIKDPEKGMMLPESLEEVWKIIDAAGPFPEIEIFGDASGKNANAQTGKGCYDLITAFFLNRRWSNGTPVRFTKRVPESNGPIRTRGDTANQAMRDLEGRSHYTVHPDCKRLIADYDGLRKGKDGLPDKGTDTNLSHASDADTYRILRLRPIAKAAVNRATGAQARPWTTVDIFGRR